MRKSFDGVRILGKGEIKAKVTLEVSGASKSAVSAIEKAGGSITLTAPVKDKEAKRLKRSGKSKAKKAAQPEQESADQPAKADDAGAAGEPADTAKDD